MKTGVVVWFTGLPSSGKTTLARRLAARLVPPPVLLDGDALREAIGAQVGFGARARADFYLGLANLAALLADQGHVVLVAATAHRRFYRQRARERARRFLEVFVDTPLGVCRDRDPKGLYRLAAKRKVATLPGVGVRYQPPLDPDVVAHGGRDRAAVDRLIELLRSP